MRTKTLLMAAAALAAGLVTSQAQSNVYSANVVGYINLNMVQGFNLVANQLDLDLNLSNNTVQTVFSSNMPVNTTVYAWLAPSQSFVSASYSSSKTGNKWGGDTNDVNNALRCGQSVFVQSPSAVNVTNTYVGNVVQGTNIVGFSSGYNMVASVPPLSGGITSNLNYQPSVGDTVYTWNPGTQAYVSASFSSSKTGNKWTPSEPQISVGQGVFINSSATTQWSNNFTVH